MKVYKRLLILLIFIMPLVVHVNAQESVSRKEKKIEKQKEKNVDDALKKYQKAIKQHNKDQSKSTRKMMRQSRKKMREADPTHKDFFLKRWFAHLKKKQK